MKKQIVSMLLVSSLLTGCAFNEQLHGVAVNHNKLVADTANEITLLNIVRAKNRQPMHYTSMKTLRGNMSVSTTASLGAGIVEQTIGSTFTDPGTPFSGNLRETSRTMNNGPETFSPSLAANIATNPNFEISIYDNKAFQSGIMTPVSLGLFKYFLSNGWPEDYLAQLFVERIDFYDLSNGSNIGDLDNDPDQYEKHEAFLAFLQQYNLAIVSKKIDPTALFPLSKLEGALSLKDISVLDGKNFDIGSSGGVTSVHRKNGSQDLIGFVPEDQLSLIDRPAYVCLDDKNLNPDDEFQKQVISEAKAKSANGKSKKEQIFPSRSFGFSDVDEKARFVTISELGPICYFDRKGVYVEVSAPIVTIRSPDGILYYLGEYIREQESRGSHDEKVIAVYTEGSNKKPLISTVYRGQRHFIAEDALHVPGASSKKPKDRSAQTLGLVQQLINLHKSAEDLPAASSVVVAQ
ncbi:hypothetical protein [Parasphingorhabdus sp. NYA22]